MIKILFICLGNICRSPAAEGIMKALIKENGLASSIVVESAGIIGYHAGESPDRRMMQQAKKRGYQLYGASRQFDPLVDFQKFDFIIGMDDENIADLQRMDPQGQYRHKIVKMTHFCQSRSDRSVPDPYYGGAQGFKEVLDILEDACKGLLEKINEEKNPSA